MKYAQIGSISRGTLNSDQLIGTFLDELTRLRGSVPRHIYRTAMSQHHPDDFLDEYDLITDLEDALAEFAPPYCYFGTHPSDGSDFGFWPDDDAIEEARCDRVTPFVDDLADVNPAYRGYVFHINDHGNLTLYNKTSKTKFREIWSII